MIIFNVITKDRAHAEQIMQHLLHEKYAETVQLDLESINFFENNQVIMRSSIKLSFITKALLYKDIEDAIEKLFPKHDFLIYSIPITQMNDVYANELRTYLRKA